jgi:HTH-type transcriptional regulator/antitoxin HigA
VISERAILGRFNDFTKVAAPVLFLKNEEAYEEALKLVEHLMVIVNEDHNKPEHLLISLLTHAIENYESSDEDISAFVDEAMGGPMDLAMLRFIIDQHQLTLSDLPEIEHKSLVSKILSGKRKLTKSHIDKLSKRFHLDPGLFFG